MSMFGSFLQASVAKPYRRCVASVAAMLWCAAGSAPGQWSEPLNLSKSAATSFMPAIAVTADNRPQLVWIDNNWDVVYRGTTAGGWGPIQNWGNAKQEYRPDICIDSLGRIAVAWCANYDDGYGTDVHWRLFENGQWSAITAFSQTANGSDNVALAAFPDGGGFYAVWEAANAQSNSYTCQGRRWDGTLGPVETIGGWAYGQYDLQYYVDPDVAIDQAGNIHVVYCVRNNPETMWEDKIHDVFYRRYNGSTWEPRVNLSRATDFIWSSGPAIALDGDGTPHVIFLSSLAGEGIYYVTRTESGWTNPVRISVANVPPGAAYEPAGVLAAADSAGDLVVDAGGTLHVVWNARNAGGADIYYRTRAGGTWSGIDNLTANASWSERARLALAPNGTLHLVYSDNISGNTEVYYRSLDPLTAPTRTFTATPTHTLTPTITPTPTITNTPRPRSPTPTPVQAAETNLRLW